MGRAVSVEHVDVVIVGAGLSGIGAAHHLRRDLPGKSFVILESRGAIGGTWDLFRYPGVRSDSDMFTLGYSFRPWTGAKTIADGDTIREYVRDAAREGGLEPRIRFHQRVVAASWSSDRALWTLTLVRTGDGEHATDPDPADQAAGEQVQMTCSFLWVCSGYYRYDSGYAPSLPGADVFCGPIIHPQHWPSELDWSGRRVVVIGSGATAVTLVPALAERAAQVTMLQRSPTYVASLPSVDRLADVLRRRLSAKAAYRLVRWRNVLTSMAIYQLCRRRPRLMKAILRRGATRALPAGYDVDTHFAPTYNPWDQRLCLVPDGDLFRAISSGRADVVTDRIDRLTPTGVALLSGRHLDADIIVSATGLNLLAIGGMALTVDGRPVTLSDSLAYKGMMLSDVPNFAMTVGYTNATWTLKADLVAQYVCRLLRLLDGAGTNVVTPRVPRGLDPSSLVPLLDLDSAYVRRSLGALPRQGPSAPWRLHQNYLRDLRLMRRGPLTDGVEFTRAGSGAGLDSQESAARATAGRPAQ